MVQLADRLSYARSLLVTAPLIFLYTGILGSLSLAASLIDASGRLQHGCARLWSRLILWTAGVRVRVQGAEELRNGKPYVLCANHQSHMDIPILLAALPLQFRFAAKKELFRIPFLGWHLRRAGHVPIDRENPRAAVKTLCDAAEKIREGAPLVIFPEGGTSLDGDIRPFKRGGFILAEQSMAEVVPVTVRGSREILAPKTYHIRGGEVEVIVGKPVSSAEAEPLELAARLRDEIIRTFRNGKTVDRDSHAVLQQD